jgi:Amiloride-sensitive sodium channel
MTPFCTDDEFRLYLLSKYSNCNECLNTLREIKIPPEETFLECKFGKQALNCTESFEEIVTRNGFCYTFNGLNNYLKSSLSNNENSKYEWNIDEAFSSTASIETYPRRAQGSGPKFGLSILLRTKKKNNDLSCQMFGGYLVSVKCDFFKDCTNIFCANVLNLKKT